MSTGFIRKLDPPHSFPFITNPTTRIGRPIPFSELAAPIDLSGLTLNRIGWKPSYNPRAISDLILWLDANDPSTFRDNNYTWKDKSNKSYISTYITSYKKIPTAFQKYTLGNLTYVDGTAAWTIQVPNFTMRPIFTLFLVATTQMGLFDINHFKPDSYMANAVVRTWGYDLFRSTGLVLQDSVAYGYQQSVVPLNEFFIFCIGYNMSNTATPYRVNGTNRDIFSNYGTVINEYITSMLTIMGWRDDTNFPALVGECMIYDRSLSSEESEKIEGYLAAKWNLQSKLPETHPYKKLAPDIAP